jgi:serine/threonine protein kinase
MEKCDYTLYDFLTETPLHIPAKESIIADILQIIASVHSRNIIHRDLSPNNIFLKSNKIIVADFGLGLNFDLVFSHQTQSTAQLGQIQYCAPEQLMSLGNTGKYSDVFSLGRLVNFILTNNPNDKNHKYKLLVEKSTSSDPASRYVDAQSMYEDFRKVKAYNEDKEIRKTLTTLINEGIYDDQVALFISSLDSQNLCQNIKQMSGFNQALYSHFENHPESILEIVNLIDNNIDRVINRFEDADNFADVAHHVLKNNLSTFEVREKAAKILNYIAYHVNRFYAQKLVNSLIKSGIEPLLEDILSNR